MIEYFFIALHFWREILLGLAVAAVVTIGVKWKHSIQQEQQLKDERAVIAAQLHVRDSTIAALHEQLGVASTAFVPESVFVTRWAVKHDTLETWRHDTITVGGVPSFPVPVATVAQNDSGKTACREAVDTCAKYRATATRIMAIQDSTIRDLRTHPLVIQASCKAHDAISFLLGGSVGFIGGSVWARR